MTQKSLLFFVVLIVATSSSGELVKIDSVQKPADIKQKDNLVLTNDTPLTMAIEVAPSTESSLLKTSSLITHDLIIATSESVVEDKTTLEPFTAAITEALNRPNSDLNSATEYHNESDASNLNNIKPLNETPKRKVAYINQQQTGRINVQLDLSDIEVIVIPNNSDPQQSLLGLLLKSVQKSNARSVPKKTKEIASVIDAQDEYSKHKQIDEENYHFDGTNMPLVESRAPYQVDISSTIGQQMQPVVDIMSNSHSDSNPTSEQQFEPQFARSPIMQLLRNAASDQKQPSSRIFKRSIGSGLLQDYIDDELPEAILNSVDGDMELIAFDNNNDSEFILLGAVENCGLGRRRNSYQICVDIADNN